MSVDQMASVASPSGALGDFGDYARRTGAASVRSSGPWPRNVILLGACLIVGVILLRSSGPAPLDPSAPGTSSQVGFVANERLAPLLSFSPPEAGRAQTHYEARVRDNPGDRWDTLTFGDAGGDDILFRVTIRSARAPLARASLFVDLAKQSAEIGAAVVRATNPQFLSKGRRPFELADLTLSGPKGERPCVGFRLDRTRNVDVSGLACGAHGAALDRVALERLIDRLSATNSGMEAGLGAALKGGAT